MAVFDLLGRRWTMRILWELQSGPLNFRALQSACGGVSPSVLNTRLKELGQARLIAATGGGYGLTPLSSDLMAKLDPLRTWSKAWDAALKAEKG